MNNQYVTVDIIQTCYFLHLLLNRKEAPPATFRPRGFSGANAREERGERRPSPPEALRDAGWERMATPYIGIPPQAPGEGHVAIPFLASILSALG